MPMHGLKNSARISLALLGLTALTLAAIPGCVGYNVYPPEPGDRGFTNPNDDPFPQVITGALQWAAVRYPPNASTEFSVAAPAGPEQDFALNLPSGMSALLAERIANNVGYGAQPLYPGNDTLPIYHVARVWISGDEAKVDVVRPVRTLLMGGPGGTQEVTQGITVRLRGGVQQWRVTSHRVWSINALPAPALNFVTAYPAGSQSPTSPSGAQPEDQADSALQPPANSGDDADANMQPQP